jgi:hypothetical protein
MINNVFNRNFIILTHSGERDNVRCFHCDIGVNKWERTDEVWVEHVRWSPGCTFVHITRGAKFVRNCIEVIARKENRGSTAIVDKNKPELVNRETQTDPILSESDTDNYLCKICLEQELGTVFLPCGHIMTCVKCAIMFTDCPFCRQEIKGVVRTFLP